MDNWRAKYCTYALMNSLWDLDKGSSATCSQVCLFLDGLKTDQVDKSSELEKEDNLRMTEVHTRSVCKTQVRLHQFTFILRFADNSGSVFLRLQK